QWLPPGMTARAIQQAVLGNWGASIAWLIVSLLASVLVLYLWAYVLERSLSTPEVGGAVRTRRHRAIREVGAAPAPQAQTAGGSIWQRISSTQAFAITVNTLKHCWRHPQLSSQCLTALT